jgi:succinate dehydrogenase hydrophobic anchor subunit
MCGGKVGPKPADSEDESPPGLDAEKREKPADMENPEAGSGYGEGANPEQRQSEAFDELRQASPLNIFITDALTLGLKSTLWMSRWMGSLERMARQDERHGRGALYVCFALYITSVALTAFVCRELYYMAGWDLGHFSVLALLSESILPSAAAGFFLTFFLVNRHMLFWAKEVITDAIQMEDADTIHTKASAFSPSPFLLWFIGVPYLQFHLNEIVRARNLANFKSSKHRPS